MILEEALKQLENKLEIQFNDAEKKAIQQEAKIIRFPKNKVILKQGERSCCIYFLLKGLIRGYYLDENGEEVTKCFSYEDSFFSTEGLRKEGISSFFIETLEGCTCMAVSYELVKKVMCQDSCFNLAVQRLFAQEIEQLEIRSKQMMLMDAKARYIAFEKDYTEIVGRVKKQIITSYIGIKPGSLSRIEKSIKS